MAETSSYEMHCENLSGDSDQVRHIWACRATEASLSVLVFHCTETISSPFTSDCSKLVSHVTNEPRCEKTGLRGF